jgi:fumarate reductase subunit D
MANPTIYFAGMLYSLLSPLAVLQLSPLLSTVVSVPSKNHSSQKLQSYNDSLPGRLVKTVIIVWPCDLHGWDM